MQTARRLYVYLLSAIGLGALIVGLNMLLTVAFEALGLDVGGPILGGDDSTRQQLTVAAALTTVGLPVWLIHWFAAERSVRPDRPGANVERDSVLRALYFALVLGALLLATATALADLVSAAVLGLSGADLSFHDPATDLAMLIVGGAAWVYHVSIRNRDWRRGPLHEAAAFLPRVYLYVAAFVGLMVLLFGIDGLIELIGRVAIDEPSVLDGDATAPWWAFALATAVSQTLVGCAIWVGHALFAERLRTDPGWRGASERPARLRVAYFVAVIGASIATAAYYTAEGMRNAIAGALGVTDAIGGAQVTGLIALPILSAVPFGLAWWLHQRWLRMEAASFDTAERTDTAERLILHAGALVGLAFGATGLAMLLGLLIRVGLGDDVVVSDTAGWQRELAQFLPLAMIGAALWIWHWTALGRRYRANPSEEAASTTRRASLLLVLGASVLAGVAGLGTVLYWLFGSLFGVDVSGSVISNLSTPLGILIVASVVAAYHASVLRRDQKLRAATALAPDGEPGVEAGRVLTVRLHGPAGADVEAALRVLRERLPAGFALEVMPPDG